MRRFLNLLHSLVKNGFLSTFLCAFSYMACPFATHIFLNFQQRQAIWFVHLFRHAMLNIALSLLLYATTMVPLPIYASVHVFTPYVVASNMTLTITLFFKFKH